MKKKLRIQELKIQSFITELDSALARTAKGGDDTDNTTTQLETISVIQYPTMPPGELGYTSKAQSLFPYNGSEECTKITTTTTTTHH